MQTPSNLVPEPITLPCGVVARIELSPMPVPDSAGHYPPRLDCDVHVNLYRGAQLIDRRAWHAVVCAGRDVALADGSALDEDDIDELDLAGWQKLMDYGLVPGALAGGILTCGCPFRCLKEEGAV